MAADLTGPDDDVGAHRPTSEHNDLAHVEVFALDALARLAAEAGDTAAARELSARADRRMTAASHFITELDRVDAQAVRELV